MKRRLLGLTAVAIFTAVVITGLFLQQRADGRENVKKAIDLTLKDTGGKAVKLSDYRGQVVLVDVWATWCGYCVHELPDLVALQAKYDKEAEQAREKAKESEREKIKAKVQIVGISVDEEKDAVTRMMKEKKINYPVLYATPQELRPFGNIRGLPTKFILNEKGVVVETIVGTREAKELARIIARHVK